MWCMQSLSASGGEICAEHSGPRRAMGAGGGEARFFGCVAWFLSKLYMRIEREKVEVDGDFGCQQLRRSLTMCEFQPSHRAPRTGCARGEAVDVVCVVGFAWKFAC